MRFACIGESINIKHCPNLSGFASLVFGDWLLVIVCILLLDVWLLLFFFPFCVFAIAIWRFGV